MDLISSIKYTENWLGGHKHSQYRGKTITKNIRHDTPYGKVGQANTNDPLTEHEPNLGRSIDTTA